MTGYCGACIMSEEYSAPTGKVDAHRVPAIILEGVATTPILEEDTWACGRNRLPERDRFICYTRGKIVSISKAVCQLDFTTTL